MNLEIREQGEAERNRKRAVDPIGRFPDSEGVGQLQLGVREKGKRRTEPRFERGLHRGRIDRDDGDLAIGNLGSAVELDQFPQLNLSLGSPRAAEKDQDQGLTIRQLGDRPLFTAIVRERQRREYVPDLVAKRHEPSSAGMLPTKALKA